MRHAVTVATIFCILTCAPLLQCQDPPSDALFTPDQLDNLLAPVALYPDPLLAQVLVAATFPDQIDEAARLVRADSNPGDIDGQAWDVSVKAVAHYPTALYLMADQLDWTTALGQAYVNQNDDVMASIQRLRAQARAAGNLQSDAQMQVVDDEGNIEIWPEQAQYIYVPDYDPSLIYFGSAGISWGAGFYIGPWLNCDFNWREHHIYYHGWSQQVGWITRSRPFVNLSSSYVNNKFRTVRIDPTVARRNVNYGNLKRYDSVHRDVTYDHVRQGNPGAGQAAESNAPPVGNKIIERNVNTSDPRINEYRGQGQEPAATPQRQTVERPPVQRQPVERAAPSAFGGNQGGFSARESSQRGQASRQEAQRPAPVQRSAPPAPRAAPAPAPAGHSGGGGRK